jgi:hypothetical protein
MLFQYADGKFTPIVLPRRDAPIGQWPNNVDFWNPVSMNQSGNAVFVVRDGHRQFPFGWLGTFLWDFHAQKILPVALQGMPATHDLTFGEGGLSRPVINDSNEIAFVADVKDASGKVQGVGLFFHGRDGKLLPVALPGQELPGGGKVLQVFRPSVNNSGQVGFVAVPQGLTWPRTSAYVWEQGTLTRMAGIDQPAPGGGKIVGITDAWVNNKNRNVLVQAILNDVNNGPRALYLFASGKLTPVAVPGQKMPGGGKFETLSVMDSVSSPNEAGQHAFFAQLDSGTGAYLMEADGKLSLIVKSGTTTHLGRITTVGSGPGNSANGVGLNNKGQVALGVKIDVLPTAIILLTPTGQ